DSRSSRRAARRILRASPTSDERLYYYRSLVLLNAGMRRRAERAYNNGLSKQPEHAVEFVVLAERLDALKAYSTARREALLPELLHSLSLPFTEARAIW